MTDDKPLVPAAQYLRMSTEHQQYSFENQLSAIRAYAQEHGFVVVRSYEDHAKSGLLLGNRPGLSTMLKDVGSHDIDFEAVLVLDVSRWGRFQDIDESAYYEFLCKQAGVPVHYCAETFSNDTTLVNMIVKSLKRSMAAEYSRELSAKVKVGIRRIALLGFRNGGTAGYGLRRLVINHERMPRLILGDRQRKSLSTDRVILTPGPAEEVQCVREIFRLYVKERLSTAQIAGRLNSRGIAFLHGRSWYQMAVLRILTHPKYCGCHVFGQSSQILKGPRIIKPRDTWCVVPSAFEPIVSREIFDDAQRINLSRTIFKSNEQLLDDLRTLWKKHGRLTQKLICQSRDIASIQVFRSRFGSLREAYQLIGYSGHQSSLAITETRTKMAVLKRNLVREIVGAFPGQVSVEQKDWRQRLRLRMKDRSVVAVHVCRPPRRSGSVLKWLLDTGQPECCKLSLIARPNEDCREFFDFHVLSCIRKPTRIRLAVNDTRLRGGIRFTKPNEFLSAKKKLCGSLRADRT